MFTTKMGLKLLSQQSLRRELTSIICAAQQMNGCMKQLMAKTT